MPTITLKIEDWEKIKKHSGELDIIASCSIDENYKKVSDRLWKVINKYDFAYMDKKPRIKVHAHKEIQQYLSHLEDFFGLPRGDYRKHFTRWLDE